MDLKVLFHNPESLSDEELSHMRQKIALQRTMPYLGAFFGGFATYALQTVVLKRMRAHWIGVGTGALVGFALGGYSAYQVKTTLTRVYSDSEIISAFDRRYMNTVLNTTGFGSNYISVKDYSETQSFKKPY